MKLIFVLAGIALILFGVGLVLMPHTEKKESYISITFDDGYVSQYDAMKQLENYGWRGVVYFPSGLAGGYFEGLPIMSWEQLGYLHTRGHEIGAHTLTHARASNLSKENFEFEVKEGKLLLMAHQINADSFAYPYNDVNYPDIIKKYFSSQRNVNGGINEIGTDEIYGLALVHDNYQQLLPEYLGDLKSSGGWLVLVIHNIDNNPRHDIDLSPEEYTWVLEQVKASGISVKTVSEIRNGTT
jgi:peptidoglycan/xylan/chitin deacetylase (PgdA/CDA1 family)